MPTSQPSEDQLIGCLHQAALDRAGWQAFVSALEQVFGGAKASIHGATGPKNAPFLSVSGSFDPTFARSYVAHYQRINPFMPLSAALPPGRARVSPMDLPDEKLRRTEFYNDWLRPQDDLSLAVALKSRPYHDRTVVLSLNIRRQDGDQVALRAQQMLDRLEPHVSHAFQVAEIISSMSARHGQPKGHHGEAGGLLMMDDRLSLIWAEPDAILQDGEVFRLNPFHKVTFRDSAVQEWAKAVCQTSGKTGRLSCVAQTADGWQIRFVSAEENPRLPSPFFGGTSFAGPRNLFLLSKPRQAAPPQMVLQVRFGLTSTEAEIATAIAKGRSTNEIAAERQVSHHTVRNQVRAVLDKMDARHRIDVTRMLMQMNKSYQQL